MIYTQFKIITLSLIVFSLGIWAGGGEQKINQLSSRVLLSKAAFILLPKRG